MLIWWRFDPPIFSGWLSDSIKGLVTQYILFFIDIASRPVHIAGITSHPYNAWMTQVARNITDMDGSFLCGKRSLILDRDAKYSEGFRHLLVREGMEFIRLPPRSPNLNAFAQRLGGMLNYYYRQAA